MKEPKRRGLSFVGSALKDIRKFPQAVRRQIGFDLDAVQCGETPGTAKTLKGVPAVMELVERHDTDTYRAVYVAKFADKVYVLHCFKKKSKRGIKTPKEDMDLIRQRLRLAQEDSKGK